MPPSAWDGCCSRTGGREVLAARLGISGPAVTAIDRPRRYCAGRTSSRHEVRHLSNAAHDRRSGRDRPLSPTSLRARAGVLWARRRQRPAHGSGQSERAMAEPTAPRPVRFAKPDSVDAERRFGRGGTGHAPPTSRCPSSWPAPGPCWVWLARTWQTPMLPPWSREPPGEPSRTLAPGRPCAGWTNRPPSQASGPRRRRPAAQRAGGGGVGPAGDRPHQQTPSPPSS